MNSKAKSVFALLSVSFIGILVVAACLPHIRNNGSAGTATRRIVLESVLKDFLTNERLVNIRNEQARGGSVSILVAVLIDCDDNNYDRTWPRNTGTNTPGWKVLRGEEFDPAVLSEGELPVVMINIDRNDFRMGKPEFYLDGPVQVSVTQIGKDGKPSGIGGCFLSYYINSIDGDSAQASFLGYLCH